MKDEAQLRMILSSLKRQIDELRLRLDQRQDPFDYVNKIEGRRMAYTLVGSQLFDSDQDGQRGGPINLLVSQDGPFVMTHYPLVIWRTTLPTNATDFGRWRPVSSWPLADQVLDTCTVDISYELFDAGPQRAMQNEAVPPLLSRPDQLAPCPIPTLLAPNTTLQFIPTYHNIDFGGSTPATEGRLVVAIPGYRIVNM